MTATPAPQTPDQPDETGKTGEEYAGENTTPAIPPAPPVTVPAPTWKDNLRRYAKTHVALAGILIGVVLNFFADTTFMHTYGNLIVALLTAAGIYGIPNAPSQTQQLMAANALAAQRGVPPEGSVDVSAPVAPADLQDVQK